MSQSLFDLANLQTYLPANEDVRRRIMRLLSSQGLGSALIVNIDQGTVSK